MNIEHATKSDAFVRRKYEDHKPILARLAGGPSEVAALFPSVETPDRVDQEAVASLKALMAQLDALITQREELATRLKQLRDSVRRSSIEYTVCQKNNRLTMHDFLG